MEQTGPDPDDAATVALVEPVRLQLIALASDVVGRLPAEEVPPSLRAIARFTRAKRDRLGAVHLAAALDADEVFRGRVAAAVAQASPQLAEAVRTGTSTAAADPVDVALVAYLLRPAGWPALLARANERWVAEPGSGTADDELGRLRQELRGLRAAARAEPARLRGAVAEAAARSDAELGELRRTVRERTRELRAAERERDAAREAETQLRQRVEDQDTARDAELRRLRARVAELERAGEAQRREARAGRELDDARLWLLLDSVVQAAGGLRRELSLAAPKMLPAETVAAREAGTGARRLPDAPSLDAVLALPHAHVVVDGYNVTKTGYPALSLAEQRSRLIGALAGLAARSGAEVTVAFDGAKRPPLQPAAPRGVRVLFSAADELADDLIRRLIAAEPAGRTVVVVTSDQQVVSDATRAGSWTAPSAVLLALLG